MELNSQNEKGEFLESAGVMYGYRMRDGENNFTKVMGYIPIPDEYTERSYGEITFKSDAWAHVNSSIDRLNENKPEDEPEMSIVGWVHSHPPGWEGRLSGTDEGVNQVFQSDGQFALVITPSAEGSNDHVAIFSKGGAAERNEVDGKEVQFGAGYKRHRGYYEYS